MTGPQGAGVVVGHRAGFLPTDIAGCALWLDASDLSTILALPTNPAQTWADKSGNARDVVAANTDEAASGARSQNGLNVLDFDGGDGYQRNNFWYGLGASSAFVVFLVDTDPTDTVRTLLSETRSSATAPELDLRYRVSSLDAFQRTDGNVTKYSIQTGNDPTDGSPHIARYTDSGTAISLVLDGGTAATASYTRAATTVDKFNVGFIKGNANPTGARWHDGWIAEIIVYGSVLSGGDITIVETYLHTKWGF